LPELWSCLEGEPGAILYAGGTDLLVKLRSQGEKPDCLVCLERVQELQGVRHDEEGLWIGAFTTHSVLLQDQLVRKDLPVLVKALESLGSPQIRNMGTIGGNICTASPAGDCLPPLYLLDAVLEVRSRDAVRRVPIGSFITGPGETKLREGEILSGVRVTAPEGFNVHHFEKTGQRKSMAIAIASLAALLRVSPRGLIEEARLAWGSIGPTVVRSPEIEQALAGLELSRPSLMRASKIISETAAPIDDLRASADYRRQVSGNLLLRLLA